MYTVNNPRSYYIDTCSKKLIQSEIIIQIRTLFSATFTNCQLWLRTCWLAYDRETGRSHNKLAICLSLLHYKKANYEKWFNLPGMLKPANEVN